MPLDRVRARQPPDVVTLGILQPIERQLRAFPRRLVALHPRDQCLEGAEMIGNRRSPKPMIESMLAKGALGPVDGFTDGIEIEIAPRPVVE